MWEVYNRSWLKKTTVVPKFQQFVENQSNKSFITPCEVSKTIVILQRDTK